MGPPVVHFMLGADVNGNYHLVLFCCVCGVQFFVTQGPQPQMVWEQ